MSHSSTKMSLSEKITSASSGRAAQKSVHAAAAHHQRLAQVPVVVLPALRVGVAGLHPREVRHETVARALSLQREVVSVNSLSGLAVQFDEDVEGGLS